MFLANATIDTSSFRNFSTQPLARSGKSHSPTTEMAARKASPRSNSRGKAMAPRRTSNITVVSLMEVSIGRSFCLILFITSLLVSVDTIRERIRCTISVRHWDDLMGDCVLRERGLINLRYSMTSTMGGMCFDGSLGKLHGLDMTTI